MNNTTYSAKKGEIESKWYIIDAANKPLGRVATEAAKLLRGKHKPTFTPNVDMGDHVIILNCKDVILTGNKLNQKIYRHHSGYIGGMKEVPAKVMLEKNPEKAMTLAIKGMLPHNSLGRQMAKKENIVFYGTGRRKNAVARVRIVEGTGKITINGKDIDEFFGLETLKVIAKQPLTVTNTLTKYDVIATVKGGGFTGQAGAIRHGIARALNEANSEYRPALKSNGFLTRDPRMKERKKYGLKKARKAPQFSKR